MGRRAAGGSAEVHAAPGHRTHREKEPEESRRYVAKAGSSSVTGLKDGHLASAGNFS